MLDKLPRPYNEQRLISSVTDNGMTGYLQTIKWGCTFISQHIQKSAPNRSMAYIEELWRGNEGWPPNEGCLVQSFPLGWWNILKLDGGGRCTMQMN